MIKSILTVFILSLSLTAHAQLADEGVSSEQPQALAQQQQQQPNQAKRQRQMDVFIGLCAGQKLAQLGIEVPIPTAGQKAEAPSEDIVNSVKSAMDECYTQITGREKVSASSADVSNAQE